MTLKVKPEIAVDIPESDLELGLPEKMEAAATTAAELAEHGLDLEVTKEDQENAAKLVAAYAEDPEGTSKKVTLKRAATLTPASLIMTDKILKEFGQSVVESS